MNTERDSSLCLWAAKRPIINPQYSASLLVP